MKAIRLHESGAADKLIYEDAPKPEINESQVLVKVYASSVNQIDWKKAQGLVGSLPEFPWIPGMDFAGTVESVGDNVTSFKEGDVVFGCANGGTYAEYVAADPAQIVMKPFNLSYVDAAAAAFVAQTAWQAVNDYGLLVKGQRVLIHGAAGAVGAFAVQFARQIGAEVYASAGGSDREFVMSLGADRFIDYRKDDFTKIATGMDLVIDTVGGETNRLSYGVLNASGRLVMLTMPVDKELADKYFVKAVYMGVKPSAENLKKIAALLENNQVKVDIAAVFWLRDACKAWMYVLEPDLSKKMHGKVVLQVL